MDNESRTSENHVRLLYCFSLLGSAFWFGDDRLRQARSRRRFQTGVLIILLLFFMDSRSPQEAQIRKRAIDRAEWAHRNQKTIEETVQKLGAELEAIPHGRSFRLRNLSSFKGKWRRGDKKDMQTVVPEMRTASAVGDSDRSTAQPDLRNETIAATKTASRGGTRGKMWAEEVTHKGEHEVSMVQGTLPLESSITLGASEVRFEGLFFHKFGHLSAVVGVAGEPLKLVWDDIAGAAAAAGLAQGGLNMTANSSSSDAAESLPHLENGAAGGRLASSENASATIGGGKADAGGDSSGGDGVSAPGIRARPAGGDSSGQQDAAATGEGKDPGRGVRGRSRRDRRARGLDTRDSVAEPRRQADEALGTSPTEKLASKYRQGGEVDDTGHKFVGASDRTMYSAGSATQGGDDHRRLRQRRLPKQAADDAAPPQSEPPLEGTVPANAVGAESSVELDASATAAAEGEQEGNDEATPETAGAAPRPKFPAMVVPDRAIVGPEQKSGVLPSQLYKVPSRFKSGCLFLLNLQAPPEDTSGASEDEGGSTRTRKPFADHMTGELVGINCNFWATIDVQFAGAPLGTGPSPPWSYPMVFTMVCLLHMSLLLCRVGFMLAQRRFGRHFLLPRRFQPPKFDYHRPIPPELLEQASRETAGGQDSAESRDLEAGNLLECAICYASVDGALQDYMLTPCDHVFHEGCLTRWMRVKMECPTCRRELPPPLE